MEKIFIGLCLAFVATFAFTTVSTAGEKEMALKVIPLGVEGMTCRWCEPRVKRALEKLDGVTDVEVSYKKGKAVVEYDPSKVTPRQMIDAVDKTGFKANLKKE